MVKLIVGLMGSSVASGSTKLNSPEALRPFLAMLKKHSVHELDTARVYNAGKSEEYIGAIPEARQNFAVATKAPGFYPGSLTYQKVLDACNASLAALKQDKIELYYFHGPDRRTPMDDSCRAMNQLHSEGKIGRFGVSNCNREEVEKVHAICESHGWVLPTVYQGGYNPLGRTVEKELFPTLRKLGIAFYAYSPLAGGFFSRPTEELRNPPAGGRMDQMPVFNKMYVTPLTLELHDTLTATCEKEGLSLKSATLRWLSFHSMLGKEDGIILGGSSTEQMEENLRACEAGPLPDSIVAGFEDLWARFTAAGNAPPYCV